MTNHAVQPDSAVLLHFDLKLADGQLADSTRRENKPALFRLGDGSLSAELEQALLGLREGDQKNFSLAPESAFGPSNPDLIQFYSRRNFIETGVPDVGTIMLFTGIKGSEMPGLISDVAEDSITVDFNHPLAGKVVWFDIEVLAIDPQLEATDEHTAG
ncbi:MAG: FKBP-type peptidyl-prolyl cis-trans isomerase [Sodalis sp. (in: enterobacteria)]|uniref:FKBP-type peptidyl-prolyl cis-trans isomerase n=1 Tax=Sodalis sp. (in: enterobacteria) TaxID=1898979 RepID=UPI0039E39DBE